MFIYKLNIGNGKKSKPISPVWVNWVIMSRSFQREFWYPCNADLILVTAYQILHSMKRLSENILPKSLDPARPDPVGHGDSGDAPSSRGTCGCWRHGQGCYPASLSMQSNFLQFAFVFALYLKPRY